MNNFELLYDELMGSLVTEATITNHNNQRVWIIPDELKDKPYIQDIINALEKLHFNYISNEVDSNGNFKLRNQYMILNVFVNPKEKPMIDITGHFSDKDKRRMNNWNNLWSRVIEHLMLRNTDFAEDVKTNPGLVDKIKSFNWQSANNATPKYEIEKRDKHLNQK